MTNEESKIIEVASLRHQTNLKSTGELMENKKKISAAIAAVMHYIQEEEAVLRQQTAMNSMPQVPSAVSAPATSISPWSLNGRQTQMQMRNLMQMRTFR
jgi:hypothetical protein